ncbi:MAG TPA: SDR family NAD(P)-dependent oxidoreductase [Candidatus Tumulicola sp.]
MPDAMRAMIVTGASSGIGRALALAAARAGFGVLIVARRAARLDEVAAAIRAGGGTCEVLVADVTARETPARIVASATHAFGRIDVLVNNAGAGAYGDLLAQTDGEIDAQWQLHVAGPLRIARAALPQLERTAGSLVFVGSGLARVPLPAFGAYAPVKAAIRATATQLRRELRTRRIGVTYVDPGVVATEFHGAMGTHRPSRIKAVSPERVARAILRGIGRRKSAVNAVPWQTAGTIAGEWLATLADPAIARMRPERRDAPPTETGAAPVVTPADPQSFDAALEPVARRMERVKLPAPFVRSLLQPGTTLELTEVALRWAGMPNKNERAALHEVFEALRAAGYLEPMGDESWKVVRAAD